MPLENSLKKKHTFQTHKQDMNLYVPHITRVQRPNEAIKASNSFILNKL